MTLSHKLELSIPFETERQAGIALRTIEPDPELKPDQFSRAMTQNGNTLTVQFAATTDRTLRVGVNSFMDCMKLVVECIDELDPETNDL